VSDTATPDLKKRIDTIEGGYELFLSYAAKGQRADPQTGGELRRCIEEMDAAVEQALVDLAVTLAQALVRRELRSDSGQVVAVVREALAALPVASRHVRVCLHPDDVVLVTEALVARDAGSDAGRDWHLQEDPTLMRGDCRILSENSQIDATMEKRLATVVAQLSGGEREQDAVAVDTSVDGDAAATDAASP